MFCNDFRHPALLAKEAAELDGLTDRRFELGVCAGWLKAECDMIGVPFDSGRVRADRFQEAVRIVRRLLAGETVTHHGDHYTLEECKPADLPIQNPVPLFLFCRFLFKICGPRRATGTQNGRSLPFQRRSRTIRM